MVTPDLDIRWKQRLQNFTRVKNMLDEVNNRTLEEMDSLEIAGAIHLFDLTFELAWKTLRDYMIFQGESERLDFTREVLQVWFSRGYLVDMNTWVQMLTDRNTSTHEYDEKNASQVVKNIQTSYISTLGNLHEKLSSHL